MNELRSEQCAPCRFPTAWGLLQHLVLTSPPIGLCWESYLCAYTCCVPACPPFCSLPLCPTISLLLSVPMKDSHQLVWPPAVHIKLIRRRKSLGFFQLKKGEMPAPSGEHDFLPPHPQSNSHSSHSQVWEDTPQYYRVSFSSYCNQRLFHSCSRQEGQ